MVMKRYVVSSNPGTRWTSFEHLFKKYCWKWQKLKEKEASFGPSNSVGKKWTSQQNVEGQVSRKKIFFVKFTWQCFGKKVASHTWPVWPDDYIICWPVWPDGYIICWLFGHLQEWKLARIFRVGSKFCQTLNKSLQNWPKLLKYCQSDESLPNFESIL